MRGVAAVDPALLHLDAVPLARGVDDAGGVVARLLVPRRLVPGEVARRAGLLEQGVFVQAAVVAVLRQSGEHRDPRLRLPEGDGEAVRRGELRCLRVRHAVERARGIGRGKVAVPVERGGDGRARRRLGRLPRLVVPELDHVVVEPVGDGVGDGRGLPVAVAVHGRALVAHRACRARHARLLQRERAVRLEQVFAAVALVHARLHIAVLERAAQRVVAAVFGGGGDGHVLGVKIVQHDGHGRPVRARHVRPGVLARAGGARLQRQLHAHVLKLGLERRRVPHLRGRDAHGIRDAVGERAAVVEERIPLLARRRAVAGGQRVGHGGRAVRLLRDRAEHLLIVAQALALAHVLAHAVDVAEAVRVVLGQLDGLSVLLKQDGAAVPGQRGLHHAPAGEHGRGRAGLLPLAVAPQLQGALRALRRRLRAAVVEPDLLRLIAARAGQRQVHAAAGVGRVRLAGVVGHAVVAVIDGQAVPLRRARHAVERQRAGSGREAVLDQRAVQVVFPRRGDLQYVVADAVRGVRILDVRHLARYQAAQQVFALLPVRLDVQREACIQQLAHALVDGLRAAAGVHPEGKVGQQHVVHAVALRGGVAGRVPVRHRHRLVGPLHGQLVRGAPGERMRRPVAERVRHRVFVRQVGGKGELPHAQAVRRHGGLRAAVRVKAQRGPALGREQHLLPAVERIVHPERLRVLFRRGARAGLVVIVHPVDALLEGDFLAAGDGDVLRAARRKERSGRAERVRIPARGSRSGWRRAARRLRRGALCCKERVALERRRLHPPAERMGRPVRRRERGGQRRLQREREGVRLRPRAQRRRGGAGEAEAGEQLLRQAQVRAAVDRDVQHGIEPRAGRGPQPVPVAKVQKDQRRVRHRRRAGRDEPLRQGGERLRKRRAGSALRQRRLQRVRRDGRCAVFAGRGRCVVSAVRRVGRCAVFTVRRCGRCVVSAVRRVGRCIVSAVRRDGRCLVSAGRGRCAAGFVSIIIIRRGRGRPVP